MEDHGTVTGAYHRNETAGDMMTDAFISLCADATVAEAFGRIREAAIDSETVYTCYITDEGARLVGWVGLRTLLLARPEEALSLHMNRGVVSVRSDADSSDVGAAFQSQDAIPLPVVDEDGRILGVITADDAMDALRADTEEDFAKMAAFTPRETPYLMTSARSIFLSRIPWLLLLMISATFTGLIISAFESSLSACVYLTAFIPMLMDTGGNSGNQASVTVIRALSLGEIGFCDLLRVIKKEATVAFLCAVALGIASFGKIYIIDFLLLRTISGNEAVFVPAVVALTLFCTVLFAKLVGASLPIAAKRLGFDPAVMASPFITTLVDTVALATYFQIARCFIPGL